MLSPTRKKICGKNKTTGFLKLRLAQIYRINPAKDWEKMKG